MWCPDDTGVRSTMVGWCVRCALVCVNSKRTSVVSASSRQNINGGVVLTTYGRSIGLLRRSDREEAAQPPLLPRHAGVFPSAPRVAISPAASARTGSISQVARVRTLAGRRHSGSDRAGGGAYRGCRCGGLPRQRSGDLSRVRGRRGAVLPRLTGSRRSRSPRGRSCEEPHGRSSTATWTPPTSTSRASPSASTTSSAAGGCSRCSTRSVYLVRETRSLGRDRRPC